VAGGEELEGSEVEEVLAMAPIYSINRIDAHLVAPGDHVVAMDLRCDRYCCRTCDEWLEPPCSCTLGEDCPFPDQPEKPSMSKGPKEDVGSENLESMRKRASRGLEGADRCEKCKGAKGGVFGNENIVRGRILCDYCHAEEMP
jgi:hypothetical protein